MKTHLFLFFVIISALITLSACQLTGEAKSAVLQETEPGQGAVNEPALRTQSPAEEHYIYGAGLEARYKDGELIYTHQDYLGSSRATTNSEGNPEEDNTYLPYGESLGASGERFSFTGKESEGELMYYGARYYDVDTGRFTQKDPISDGRNWYAYANNNPLKYVDPSGEFVEMTNPQGILYNWGSKRILAFFSEVYVTFDLTGKQNVFLIHAENEAQLYRTVEEVNAINDISPIIADTDELKHISVASNLQDGDLGRANRLFGSIELADPPTALAHELPHFSPAQRAMKNVEAEYDSSLFSAFISKRRGRSLDMHEQMALRAYEADDLEIWKRYYYQETSWPASYGEVIPLRYQRFGAIKDLASRVANSRFGRATTRIGRATTRILGQALPNDINTVLGLTPTPPNIPLPGMTANQMARARA